jgi:hypothetical protein
LGGGETVRFGRVNPLLASLVFLAAGYDLGVRANAGADMNPSLFVAAVLLALVAAGEYNHYRRRRAVGRAGEDDVEEE